MSSWTSYGRIHNLGHNEIAGLLNDVVRIDEKIDGSQFSWGLFDEGLRFRSKGAEILADAPEKMFAKGVEYIKSIQHKLIPGWTYRGEYLKTNKHNALAYDRAPKNHIVLFDINHCEEGYVSYTELCSHAMELDLEVVPRLYFGGMTDPKGFLDVINGLLDCVSFLGGQKIEGVVIKAENLRGRNGERLMGKHVSASFREVHKREWKAENPKKADVVQFLGEKYTTAARWNKAVIHLAEVGKLESSPKDIGALMKEVQRDVAEECAAEIKEALYKWAEPQILRMVTRGLPDWYKGELVKKQVGVGNEVESAMLAHQAKMDAYDAVIAKTDAALAQADGAA